MLPKFLLDKCSSLNVETLDDLERVLREAGYSDSAVKEILRWYRLNSTDRRT